MDFVDFVDFGYFDIEELELGLKVVLDINFGFEEFDIVDFEDIVFGDFGLEGFDIADFDNFDLGNLKSDLVLNNSI